MTHTTRTTVALLVIAALAAVVYVRFQQRPISAIVSNSAAPTTGVVVATSSKVNASPAVIAVVQPQLNAPIVFGKEISADARVLINKKLAEFRAMIMADKYDFNAWVNLGTTYKIGGDYKNALAIWEYASKAWPTNIVSFANLGDLYANYLKDYPKAEANYLKALSNNAADINTYRNLFTLYSETSYKPSNSAAEDILKKGIVANPKAVELQVMLARWYAKLGRTDDAKAMFQAAADNATKQGQTQLAAQIKADAAK